MHFIFEYIFARVLLRGAGQIGKLSDHGVQVLRAVRTLAVALATVALGFGLVLFVGFHKESKVRACRAEVNRRFGQETAYNLDAYDAALRECWER
jgi:hypothetical protein